MNEESSRLKMPGLKRLQGASVGLRGPPWDSMELYESLVDYNDGLIIC